MADTDAPKCRQRSNQLTLERRIALAPLRLGSCALLDHGLHLFHQVHTTCGMHAQATMSIQ
jgi:hypothetical protein